MNSQLYNELVAFHTTGKPTNERFWTSNFRRDARKYDLKNGVLYRNGGIVVQEQHREELWEAYHCGPNNTGHYGKKAKKKGEKKRRKLMVEFSLVRGRQNLLGYCC